MHWTMVAMDGGAHDCVDTHGRLSVPLMQLVQSLRVAVVHCREPQRWRCWLWPLSLVWVHRTWVVFPELLNLGEDLRKCFLL